MHVTRSLPTLYLEVKFYRSTSHENGAEMMMSRETRVYKILFKL